MGTGAQLAVCLDLSPNWAQHRDGGALWLGTGDRTLLFPLPGA